MQTRKKQYLYREKDFLDSKMYYKMLVIKKMWSGIAIDRYVESHKTLKIE